MAGSTENLIQGVGFLYVATIGTSEPADADIADPPGAEWRGLGFTQEGVTLTISQEYTALEVDQLVDVPGQRLTSRNVVVATSLAEATLDNLASALNELAAQVVETAAGAGTPGTKKFEPRADGLQGEPDYAMILLDGYAPNGFPRRVIVRRALQTGEVEAANTKDGQTVFPVEFAGHYVSSSVAPYKVVDQTAVPS